jgi:hypothetical protein
MRLGPAGNYPATQSGREGQRAKGQTVENPRLRPDGQRVQEYCKTRAIMMEHRGFRDFQLGPEYLRLSRGGKPCAMSGNTGWLFQVTISAMLRCLFTVHTVPQG